MFQRKIYRTVNTQTIIDYPRPRMVGNFAVKNLSNALDEEYEIPFDVNLRVSTNASYDAGSVMIPCHKLALALSSPFFTKLFFSGKDNAEPPLEYGGDIVTMKDVDPEVIRMIVKFCYNKRLELSSRSLVFLVELYIAAASLEIPDLQVSIICIPIRMSPKRTFKRRSS